MTTGILHLHLALGLLLFALLLAGKVPRLRALSAITALLVLATGLFNFMTQMKGAPAGWHAGIGIKLLLGLHVIAIVLLSARGTASAEKLAKWRKGALISGAVTILIGLYFSNFAR
jgi:hypothetical protein